MSEITCCNRQSETTYSNINWPRPSETSLFPKCWVCGNVMMAKIVHNKLAVKFNEYGVAVQWVDVPQFQYYCLYCSNGIGVGVE